LLIVACGTDLEPSPPPATPPATLADLRGPWSATPFALDAVTLAGVVDGCARDLEIVRGTAAIVDARGAEVVTVRMTGNQSGSCDALQITAAGEVAGAGSGWRANATERITIPNDASIAGIETQIVQGGGLSVTGWSVYGRAGSAIRTIQVIPADHLPVTATFVNGWFAAWWPSRPNEPSPDLGRFPPFRVRGFDGAGMPLIEVQH
jgi:hypothetical protein